MRKFKVKSSSSVPIDDISTWRRLSQRAASASKFENIDELSKISSSETSEQTNNDSEQQKKQAPVPMLSSHSSDTLQQTLQDILNPLRIAALEACDVKPIPYNPYSISSYIFSLKGRNLSMMLPPLIALLFWGLGWQLLFMFLPRGDSYNEVTDSYVSDLQRTLSSVNDLISTMVTPVSFLLVFRLGRAAMRFWDARQAAGLMIELCRTNIATVTVGFISPIRQQRRYTKRQKQRHDNTGNDRNEYDANEMEIHTVSQSGEDIDAEIELLCEYARWLASFPVAVKHFLRPEERLGWDDNAYYKKNRFEIGPLLCDEDANHIMFSYDDERGKAVFDKSAKRVREPPLV